MGIYLWKEKQSYIPSTVTGSILWDEFTPTEGSDIQGCYISPDGTKMYIDFWGNKRLYQYNLSTPRMVSTASSVRYISVTEPDGIYFSNDGSYFFIGCEQDNSIKRYSLSTPRDISTATQDQSYMVESGYNYYPYNISFSEDGKTLMFGYNRVYYDPWLVMDNLSTERDLSTRGTQQHISLGNRLSWIPRNNGNYFYLSSGNGPWYLDQYELSTPFDWTTRSQVGSYYTSYTYDGRALFVSLDCQFWVTSKGSEGSKIEIYQTVPTSLSS